MDCNACVFKVTENELQVGCKVDRLSKLINIGQATKEPGKSYYELSRFCNMYRTDDCDMDKARNQIKPLFGIVIFCSETDTLEDLNRTIESILNIDYEQKRIKIVISILTTKNLNDFVHITNVLKSKYRSVELVVHLHEHNPLREKEVFLKILKATYFVKIRNGSEIKSDLFDMIDKKINDDLDQTIMFETDSATIILKNAMNSEYLNFYDYDLAADSIRKLSIEQGKYEKIQ